MESTGNDDAATVLVVDDNRMVLESLELLLEEYWPVLIAGSAAEARQVLADNDAVALIISDDRMPGESGVELLSWAADRYPGTMRILLTGFTDTENVIRAINEARVWHYLRKPWDNGELINLVTRALEFRRSKAALARSERRYRDLFHHAHLGIVRLTEAGQVMEANRSFGNSLGLRDLEQLVDRSIEDLCVDPVDWDLIIGDLRSSMVVSGAELTLRGRDGHPVHFVVNAGLRALPGGGRVVEATLQDVTRDRQVSQERDDLRSQLERAQRLVTVGSLTAGIAHDFNNQMTVALNAAWYARQLGREDEALRDCLEDIEAAATYASDLSRQLLNFTRKGSGTCVHSNDLNKVLTLVAKLTSRLAEGVTMELDLAAGLPLVRVDAAQLNQCFLNLCLNAVDAMEGKGTLRIASRLLGAGHPDGPQAAAAEGSSMGHVEVTFEDTGCGMDAEVMASIFEPFFTTKTGDSGRKGTGLGLAMVQNIVRSHKGHIAVASTPGVGTRFTVWIPVSEMGMESITMRHRAVTAPGQGTVLLADDEPGIRKAVGRMLERLGYQVLRAATGKEALDLVRRHPAVSLVILDTVMPVMDGAEAFSAIRAQVPGLPVVFISGHLATPEVQRALNQPRVALVSKPFTVDLLSRALEEVMYSA